MSTPLYVNYLTGQTDIVLGADTTNADTSWTVTVPTILAGFGIVNPSGVGLYKCLVGTEIVHFTSGAVTAGTQAWTVVRAQESTTGAIHLSGATILLEATAGALANAVQLSPTAQQTGNINVSGAVTSGGLLTGTGLTAPHASTHDVGGSDVLKDLTRLAAGPAMHGYTAWSHDPVMSSTTNAPTAGIVYLTKILTAHAFTVTAIDLMIFTAGTGVTALANCFVGIYDSGGTRRYLSADQSSAWASIGGKSISLGGSAYTVTANDFIYLAFVVGTQSTTNVKLLCGPNSQGGFYFPVGLTAATSRSASQLTSQTTLPSSLTLSSNSAPNGILAWFAVK